jgi:hypothetical protein
MPRKRPKKEVVRNTGIYIESRYHLDTMADLRPLLERNRDALDIDYLVPVDK